MNYQVGDIVKTTYSGNHFMIINTDGDYYTIQYLKHPDVKSVYGKRYINENSTLVQKGSR